MTIQEITKTYNRIVGSLDHKELKNAFDLLQSFIAGIRDYSFQDRLNELQNTYKYMLRYRVEGVKDPMQEQIYKNLFVASYELADLVKHKGLSNDSSLCFYSHRRMNKREAASFQQLHHMLKEASDLKIEIASESITQQQQIEAATITLFEKLWTSDPLRTDEVVEIQAMLNDKELPFTVGCQLVSALLLGLQIAFDKEKLMLLFEAAALPEEEIRYRALIGILLTLYTYQKRTSFFPQIADRLDALAEVFPAFKKAIRIITLRFILARETEKINQKLQNEILPEMMKLGPKLSQKINLKEINPDLLGNEMNPEWQEMLSNSSLGKKLEEFNELQQEGADVMHSSFIHLKQFPFFREVSNWFLPFTTDHSVFGELKEQEVGEKRMLKALRTAFFMCNSDKYSLYLSMLQMPGQARHLMMEQFSSQMPEISEERLEEMIDKRGKVEMIASQYIQDLYRFFKLHPNHLDFEDIFAGKADFHNLPILRPYIQDPESLLAIAEYYLHKNYFHEALSIYEQLAKNTNTEDYILYQKIGYCKQMSDDIPGAIEAYLHADLVQPNSKWVIRRLAGCYRTLKQPEKALLYYRRYETFRPDDLSTQISIGHCYLELRQYNEALKYYYKVDYLDNGGTRAWRPIAWCSFLTGKYDQARNYYRKIMESKPTTQDFLNAGHTEWVLQHIKEALSYYKMAVKNESDDFLRFQEQFSQDIPDLLLAGIEEEEIPLMLDQLRYLLEEA